MSNQSFKVKNGLTLTPVDLTTLVSPQAGDLACDINDSNKIKRYDANASAWTEVGSGGVGGTDILFVQDFESASPSSFTQVGLTLSQTDPLHGRVSALLTHDASVNQLFKQVIPVDNKFRNQTMVLRLDVKSNASAGNVVINIYDETNAANIVASEQLQLSNDVNGTKNSVGFTIPETCASLSYTITALPEAGSPVTRIDDIICELAETALLETAVEVPVITAWQGYTPTFQGFGSPSAIEFEWRQVGENVEIRGKFLGGAPTADEARVTLPAGLTSAGTNLIPSIQIIGSAIVNNTGSISVFQTLVEPSVNYVSFGFRDATRTPLTKLAGNIISANGLAFNFTASVPCSGLSATTTKTIPLTQSGLVQEGDSVLKAAGNAGQAITTAVTKVPFILASSQGSAGSWSGDTFIVSQSGIFNFEVSIYFTAAASRGIDIYFLKNGVTTTRRIGEGVTSTVHYGVATEYLNEGDQVYFIMSGSGTLLNNTTRHHLTISQQGSLKQIAVSSDQKLRIPTSELRFEGASARGTGTETGIVQFSSLTKLRGDAFTINNSNGTAITMTKAGMLSISANVYVAPTVYTYITKNQAVRTASPVPVASEILSSNGGGSNPVSNPCWTGFVNIGDIIRIYATANPVVDPSNMLNLAFQEQDISVSVTNTLPQFSESDSSIRLRGSNGFGSTLNNKIRRFSNVVLNSDSDINYVDSASDGASFTILEDGEYAISYTDDATTAAYIGLTKNSTLLTTSIADAAIVSANDDSLLAIQRIDVATAISSCAWQGKLSAGDIIRPHTNGVAANNVNTARFSISKVGKPNVTGVDVTPFVNVPQPDSENISLVNGSIAAAAIITNFTVSKNTNKGILSYSSGRITALKTCVIDINYTARSNAVGVRDIQLIKNGSTTVASTTMQANSYTASISYSEQVSIGDYFEFRTDSNGVNNASVYCTATALSDQILTAPETFSTDTASLTYAGSGTYTLSTLQNAPVGTYITFTYAANTNTRTQTTTRPTQTDEDMNANGIRIFTRAYNAASTAGNPAAFAIQIGKGLKGKSVDIYKNIGKDIAGAIDLWGAQGTGSKRGLSFCGYDEKTGILVVDAGDATSSTVTSAFFVYNDTTNATSGYLVINASKNPSVFGLGLQTVAARAVQSSGQSIANAGNIVMLYDSAKTYDTNGALNTATGVFTAPESGYYQASWGCLFAGMTSNLGQVITTTLFKNGVAFSEGAYNTMDRAVAIDAGSNGSCGVYLAKGDTVDIRIFNNRAGGATSLITSARYNFFSIHKTSLSTGN